MKHSTIYWFVTQSNFKFLVLLTSEVLGLCPEHFEEAGNKCLFLDQDVKLTWTEAEWFCKKMSAQLDNGSQQQIREVLRSKGISMNYWIAK